MAGKRIQKSENTEKDDYCFDDLTEISNKEYDKNIKSPIHNSKKIKINKKRHKKDQFKITKDSKSHTCKPSKPDHQITPSLSPTKTIKKGKYSYKQRASPLPTPSIPSNPPKTPFPRSKIPHKSKDPHQSFQIRQISTLLSILESLAQPSPLLPSRSKPIHKYLSKLDSFHMSKAIMKTTNAQQRLTNILPFMNDASRNKYFSLKLSWKFQMSKEGQELYRKKRSKKTDFVEYCGEKYRVAEEVDEETKRRKQEEMQKLKEQMVRVLDEVIGKVEGRKEVEGSQERCGKWHFYEKSVEIEMFADRKFERGSNKYKDTIKKFIWCFKNYNELVVSLLKEEKTVEQIYSKIATRSLTEEMQKDTENIKRINDEYFMVRGCVL
ncbi:unnamed protein product [Moneuplotes crassus]|uniref:Uncharacterized protein n=1 Tax=Euplotes crassus TaxID=5936 RepID=A0AAD2DB07_EUPCR|nr:unnamed protein product [Moneuplotes crassus]